MACRAAVEAVRRALPHTSKGYGYERLPPIPAAVIFRRIGWWTEATLAEALCELVNSGECETVVEGDQILFRKGCNSTSKSVVY